MMFLLAMTGLAGCSSSNDDGGGVDTPTPVTPSTTTTTVTNNATDTWGLIDDVETEPVKDYIRMVIDVQNLKLQCMKVFSNGWNGDLFCGIGDKSDPTKLYQTLRGIAEKYDDYMAGCVFVEYYLDDTNITRSGTRGDDKSMMDCLFDIYDYFERHTDEIRTCLNDYHVLRIPNAREELYSYLSADLKKGTSNAKEWFAKFNSNEYKYDCEEIFKTWYRAGYNITTGNTPAAEAFFNGMNKMYNGKNPEWLHAKEVGKIAVTTGSLAYIDAIDKVTGGAITSFNDLSDKIDDIKDIYDETSRLYKKLQDGTATTADMRSFAGLLGSKYVGEHLSEVFPDGLDDTLVNEAMESVTSEIIKTGVTQLQKEAAEGLGINLWDILDNMKSQPGLMSVIARDPATGRVTVGLPSKDGNVSVVLENGKNGKVNVLIVKGDGRTTQVIDTDGKAKEFEAMPDGSKPVLKVSPSPVHFYNWNGETKWVKIRSNYETLEISSDCDDWCKREFDRYEGELTLKALANKTGKKRSGKILIKGLAFKKDNKDFKEQTVTLLVEQDAEQEITASASPASLLDLASGRQTKTITVTTNMPYISDVTSKSGWMSFNWDKKEGGREIIVTIEPNGDLDKRDGVILIGVGFMAGATEKTIEVPVSQASLATAAVSLTPDSLKFKAEGGSQRVTMFESSFPHAYIYIKDHPDWLDFDLYSEDTDNHISEYTITVKPNTSQVKRTALIVAWGTDDMNAPESEWSFAYTIVEQEAAAVPTINVDPDHLDFEASGGTQTLTVTTNQPYWGGSKKGNWFKVTTKGNKITVTAEPNPTSEPREGSMTLYARNENKENVSEPIVIPIKQKAKAAEIFDNLKNISVSFKTTMHYYGNGKTGVDYYDEDKSTGRSFPAYGFEDKQKKDIKVTYSGNTAHIEGSWTYDFIRDDQRYKHETVIKMDITNFNDIKNAVITNLSAEELHQYYYSKNGGWELSIWEKGSISASNIPMKNKYGAEGTNKNGAVLNDCFDEGLDGWHRYTWTFLPNQDFSVSVSFSYSE